MNSLFKIDYRVDEYSIFVGAPIFERIKLFSLSTCPSVARVPLVTTDRIRRKSPEDKIVHPPIAESLLRKTRIVLFNAFTEVLFDMVTSFQTIGEKPRINIPALLPLEMLQTVIRRAHPGQPDVCAVEKRPTQAPSACGISQQIKH
ncbi:hypothetical protein EVAR_77532_1 [Eumeta japonica]|uniref:Uncharacterized protein n=1 Tax=Eumeta variegata TaxID=151549 RepID=A0A4C1T6R7_EUMVA|nr:hypothetical protein EVAR_77532_1 [Eumeta japonica]